MTGNTLHSKCAKIRYLLLLNYKNVSQNVDMRLFAVVFRIRNRSDFDDLKILEMPTQVVSGKIVHRTIGSTFEGIRFGLCTLPERRFFVRKNCEVSQTHWLQFGKTLPQA